MGLRAHGPCPDTDPTKPGRSNNCPIDLMGKLRCRSGRQRGQPARGRGAKICPQLPPSGPPFSPPPTTCLWGAADGLSPPPAQGWWGSNPPAAWDPRTGAHTCPHAHAHTCIRTAARARLEKSKHLLQAKLQAVSREKKCGQTRPRQLWAPLRHHGLSIGGETLTATPGRTPGDPGPSLQLPVSEQAPGGGRWVPTPSGSHPEACLAPRAAP